MGQFVYHGAASEDIVCKKSFLDIFTQDDHMALWDGEGGAVVQFLHRYIHVVVSSLRQRLLQHLKAVNCLNRTALPNDSRQERRSEERRVGKECRSRWS